MSDVLQAESIGPVDVAVILFEGSRFNGDVAPALVDAVDSGAVRIVDLAFVHKDTDGSVLIVEAADSEVAAAFELLSGSQFDLLNDGDLNDIGEGLNPGSSALVIVWENTWAARVAAAIRGSHGEVVFLERIPRENVLAAIEALGEE